MTDYLTPRANPYLAQLPDLSQIRALLANDAAPAPMGALATQATTTPPSGSSTNALALLGALQGSKSQDGSSPRKKPKKGAGRSLKAGGAIGAKALPDSMNNSVNENRRIAQSIIAKKYPQWNRKDYKDLVQLWNGESGWNARSDNPTSSAYGIPQALTSVHNVGHDYMNSPVAQIIWGLRYIAGKYSSPTRALKAWEARSPHWY